MKSSLFQELSEAELSLIISRALQTDVVSSRLLSGGMFNTTYLIETAEAGRVVLRVGPVNWHLLMPFEHRLMAAEKEVYALCAQNGVPSSQLLAADTTKTLLDRDYMMVRYIPGGAMSEIQLEPRDRARICRDIGGAAAKLHQIKGSRFGRIVGAESGGDMSWSQCLFQELLDWERVGVPAALFTEEEHREIRLLFQKAAPCLDEITEPRLVHTDLWLGNILVRTDGKTPEFAAIIDADRALWGDPMFEFSSIRWAYAEDSFWEGYGGRPPQSRQGDIRLAVYTLLNRLWNAYVYQREYNQPENAQRERAGALRQAALLRGWLQP